ncbi:MAG: hypothetical protein GSR77_00760 [Desulfurococcales archaeon]|nr:hypothetical protein [Desulfurococcales archaeon]
MEKTTITLTLLMLLTIATLYSGVSYTYTQEESGHTLEKVSSKPVLKESALDKDHKALFLVVEGYSPEDTVYISIQGISGHEYMFLFDVDKIYLVSGAKIVDATKYVNLKDFGPRSFTITINLKGVSSYLDIEEISGPVMITVAFIDGKSYSIVLDVR